MLMMLMVLLFLDLGIAGATQQAVGESGGEDSEDEWNYIKGDKKVSEGLTTVEESSEAIAVSPVAEGLPIEAEEQREEFENVSIL